MSSHRSSARGREGREGESIGNLRRRGMSLAVKFSVFTLLVSVLITVLFGIFSIRDLQKNMLSEIKHSGYDQVMTLRAIGQMIIKSHDLTHRSDITSPLKTYKAQ